VLVAHGCVGRGWPRRRTLSPSSARSAKAGSLRATDDCGGGDRAGLVHLRRGGTSAAPTAGTPSPIRARTRPQQSCFCWSGRFTATLSGAARAGSNPAGGTRSNMQPDMLIAALPADLHLYARPPASCSIPPLVPMSWPPMQLIARPRSKLRPEGTFLRPTSQRDHGVKHPFSGPFKPATHPVDRRDELRQAAQRCLWADPLTQSEQVGEPP
jgi:hypothetical protein